MRYNNRVTTKEYKVIVIGEYNGTIKILNTYKLGEFNLIYIGN